MRDIQGRRAKATLADVAEVAGVSVTTASFVLSGRTDMRISTSTADRVYEAARRMDYVRPAKPLPKAPGLPVIAFVTDRIASDPYAGEMVQGGILGAADQGHAMVTAQTGGDRQMEASLVRRLTDQGVALFVYSALATQTARLPADLRHRRTVLLNCVDRTTDAPTVVPDEKTAGGTAADVLLRAGHGPQIWLVGEATGWPYAGRARSSAVAARLREHGLSVARHLRCPWWPEPARTATAAALAGISPARRPTAVIALNDRIAMGVYQAAAALGWRIPEDLSVVSFDDSDLAHWLSPGLTSIGLPYLGMGRRAVEVLLGATPVDSPELLHMPLSERDSVAPPRGGR